MTDSQQTISRQLHSLLLTFAAQLLILAVSSLATARDYYVRESGRDSNDGRTAQTAWATLDRVFQESLAAGDVVYVGGGVYEIQQTVEAGGGNSSGTTRNDDDGDDRDRRRDDDRNRRSRSSRDEGDEDDEDRGSRGNSSNSNRNENGTSSVNTNGRGNGRSGSSSNGNSSSGNNSGGNNSGSGTSGNSAAVTLIGDSTGRFTGDRGRVVLSPRGDG